MCIMYTVHPRLLVASAEEKHAFADLEPLASLHDSLLRNRTYLCGPCPASLHAMVPDQFPYQP